MQSPADLAEPGVRIVAAGPGVPITRYADEALAQLAATMPDPEAFADAVAANIVSREDNVRAALAKVELGEGDAAFVYRTDALELRRASARSRCPAAVDVTRRVRRGAGQRPVRGRRVRRLAGRARRRERVLGAAGFEVARRERPAAMRARLTGSGTALVVAATQLRGWWSLAGAGPGLPGAAGAWPCCCAPSSRARCSRALAGRAVLDALVLSLSSTAVSLAIVIVAAARPWPSCWRARSFRGKALAEALVDLPIVLPPSVAGLALLFAFGRNGVAGELARAARPDRCPSPRWRSSWPRSSWPAPSTSVPRAQASEPSTPEVEEAARVDGASENAVLGRITLPLAAPAIGAGLVLAWARALGEFGATILFAGNIEGRTQTLPLLVYSEFQDSLDAAIAAATILVLAALGVLIAVRLMRWPSGASWFS